jgi:predicted nucleic acid-binding protein
MKAFFDTSVRVPVFYGDHVHHQASLRLFIQFNKSTGCCAAHRLATAGKDRTRARRLKGTPLTDHEEIREIRGLT